MPRMPRVAVVTDTTHYLPRDVVRDEGLLLGAEVVEEGAGRDAGRSGDVVHGDRVDAALGRQAQRRRGERLPRGPLLALAQPGLVHAGSLPRSAGSAKMQ